MFIIPVNYLIAVATIVDPEGGELLNKLFEEYHKRLYCVAYDVLKNSTDTENAASIAFMNIWTNIDDCIGKSDEQIIKFITVIARNAAIDVQRNKYTNIPKIIILFR